MCGLFTQRSGHRVRTSVRNFPGYQWCKSRTAAVSITTSPTVKPHFRISFCIDEAKGGCLIVPSTNGVSPPQIVLYTLAPDSPGLALRYPSVLLAVRVGVTGRSVGLPNKLLAQSRRATRGFGTISGFWHSDTARIFFWRRHSHFFSKLGQSPRRVKRKQNDLEWFYRGERRHRCGSFFSSASAASISAQVGADQRRARPAPLIASRKRPTGENWRP